jgi:hypothetical protein
MKSLKSIHLPRLNLVIYLVISLLALASLVKLWDTANQLIFNSGDLTEIKLDRPMIRMTSDVYLNLKDDVLANDSDLFQKVQRNKLLFEAINVLIFIVFIILVLLQLRSLISSLQERSFFESRNIKCVRKISYLLAGWVLTDLIFYVCIPLFIPLSVIRDSYNFWPVNGGFTNASAGILCLLLSIDYGVLLSAFAFYVIFVVFGEGSLLKEQAELTI